MKPLSTPLLKILYVLSWIIFVGLCIVAGGFITNAIFSIVNPAVVKNLWQQVDLSDLFNSNKSYFFTLTIVVSIVAVLKAILFYLIISMLHNKKLTFTQPFNKEVLNYIFKMCYVVLLIGLFSSCGAKYVEWLISQNITMPSIQDMELGGADVWLFMCIILFVIAQIFKKGIEIQTENDLTV